MYICDGRESKTSVVTLESVLKIMYGVLERKQILISSRVFWSVS